MDIFECFYNKTVMLEHFGVNSNDKITNESIKHLRNLKTLFL